MLLESAVLNYTQEINLYVKGGKLINIFLQKLAKMNYSFSLNYVSLFINSTFIDENKLLIWSQETEEILKLIQFFRAELPKATKPIF